MKRRNVRKLAQHLGGYIPNAERIRLAAARLCFSPFQRLRQQLVAMGHPESEIDKAVAFAREQSVTSYLSAEQACDYVLHAAENSWMYSITDIDEAHALNISPIARPPRSWREDDDDEPK